MAEWPLLVQSALGLAQDDQARDVQAASPGMLIAQLSDIHIGGARHHGTLLRNAIAEINDATLDVVVIAGDITDEGYPDQYGEAREQLEALACPNVVAVPGNQDSRHVGYLQYERTFGARDSVPIRGTGRERNQVLDAGDVLALLHQAEVDVVLSGHRHVPYVWPVAGMLLIRSGTAATLRTRAFNPAGVQPDPRGREQDLDPAARSRRRWPEPGGVSARLAGGAVGTIGGSARACVARPRTGQRRQGSHDPSLRLGTGGCPASPRRLRRAREERAPLSAWTVGHMATVRERQTYQRGLEIADVDPGIDCYRTERSESFASARFQHAEVFRGSNRSRVKRWVDSGAHPAQLAQEQAHGDRSPAGERVKRGVQLIERKVKGGAHPAAPVSREGLGDGMEVIRRAQVVAGVAACVQ